MPKERVYGVKSDDPTTSHDMFVGWEKLSQDDDGLGAVTVCLVEQTGDMPREVTYLDRSGINRLIRVLRRARDSAFGADA